MNSDCLYSRQAVTVNVVPADIRRQGSAFDLPMAPGCRLTTGFGRCRGRLPTSSRPCDRAQTPERSNPIPDARPDMQATVCVYDMPRP
jgi:Subunit ChlI of Mg-chelatase